MKRLFVIGALACVAVWAAQNAAPQRQQKNLSADEMKKLLEKKDVLFLDVREPKELVELGTVKGYVNIPVGQVESRLSELPKDRPIITACERGVRAGRAADILRKNGFNVIGSSGLIEWREKKYPLVYPKADGK
jgi:rhodanese-related sulfurtransferase